MTIRQWLLLAAKHSQSWKGITLNRQRHAALPFQAALILGSAAFHSLPELQGAWHYQLLFSLESSNTASCSAFHCSLCLQTCINLSCLEKGGHQILWFPLIMPCSPPLFCTDILFPVSIVGSQLHPELSLSPLGNKPQLSEDHPTLRLSTRKLRGLSFPWLNQTDGI